MKKLFGLALLALVLAGGSLFLRSESPAPVLAEEEAAAPTASPTPQRRPASSPPAIGGAPAVLAALTKTKACLASGDCDFPDTDPRSYEFAVGRKIADLLRQLRTEHPDDPSLGALAREFMEVQDGFVQEEAMKIFSMLPPSRENVEAVIQGLEFAHDPLLIEQAMEDWKRYLGSPEEALIEEFLANFIARGGQFSSEKASELILCFLNERTEARFREALASMIPTSTQAKNLREALAEYERMRSGG